MCHGNDKSFNSEENSNTEKRCGIEVFKIPVRSPELMPLDYTHWKWVLDNMRAYEDRVGWRSRKEGVREYLDRLRRTAFSINKFPDIIRKAHACMLDHAELIVQEDGGHFEDGKKALKRWRYERDLCAELESFRSKNGKLPLWIKKGWENFFDDTPEDFLDRSDGACAGSEKGGTGKPQRKHWTRSPRIAAGEGGPREQGGSKKPGGEPERGGPEQGGPEKPGGGGSQKGGPQKPGDGGSQKGGPEKPGEGGPKKGGRIEGGRPEEIDF